MNRVSTEVIAFFAVIFIAVVMSMRAMHVLMRDFFFSRFTHIRYFQCKAQRHTCQWMIAVEYNLVVSDIGNGENQRLLVFIFTSCAVMRLARFNVEQAGRKKTYFHGLPSPAAGLTLATYYWFSQTELYSQTVILFTDGATLTNGWRDMFASHSDRFLLGSDTWINERSFAYDGIMKEYRGWLAQLPEDQARRIAHGNAERIFGGKTGE